MREIGGVVVVLVQAVARRRVDPCCLPRVPLPPCDRVAGMDACTRVARLGHAAVVVSHKP